MKVNGIIAEYNPFHNGHKYQINDAKKATGADYTIVVMSGNFVQRGEPALIHKYKRAEAALRNGADLVLELPMFYATASAEYFAAGAVSLLDRLGVVTHLCFGSECGDVALLKRIADILHDEPKPYTEYLQDNLRSGMSFPLARTEALIRFAPELSHHRDVLTSPNNILGIEYLKALTARNSVIQPYTTLRSGAGYHDSQIQHSMASATAIRSAIMHPEDGADWQQTLPEDSSQILSQASQAGQILCADDFSQMLHYRLLTESDNDFGRYLDVTENLSRRIIHSLESFQGFDSFCDVLASKELTLTRIRRCLLHILLGIDTATMEQYRSNDYTCYARVLGFRSEAAPLLRAVKTHGSLPLLTKLADAPNVLPPEPLQMLERDIRMNKIYESAASLKANVPMLNEYRTPIVII